MNTEGVTTNIPVRIRSGKCFRSPVTRYAAPLAQATSRNIASSRSGRSRPHGVGEVESPVSSRKSPRSVTDCSSKPNFGMDAQELRDNALVDRAARNRSGWAPAGPTNQVPGFATRACPTARVTSGIKIQRIQSDLRDKDPKDNESLQSISRSYALSNFPCRKHQDSWMACECTSENLGALHSELHTVILDR
jgi:hypothetical protein